MTAKRDRRREIAEAALRSLRTHGPAGLTARRVAAEAGLSLGHISYNFSGMDEVLSEAYRLASEELRSATMQSLQAASAPEERLRAFLAAGFTEDFLTPDMIRSRIDLWSAALAHPAIAETERALYDRYRAALGTHLAAIAAPGREGAIPALSDLIMAALDGLWLDWMRRRDAGAVQNGLDALMDLAQLRLSAP